MNATFYGKKPFDVMELSILRWAIILDDSRRPNVITRVPVRRRQEGQSEEEEMSYNRSRSWSDTLRRQREEP